MISAEYGGPVPDRDPEAVDWPVPAKDPKVERSDGPEGDPPSDKEAFPRDELKTTGMGPRRGA